MRTTDRWNTVGVVMLAVFSYGCAGDAVAPKFDRGDARLAPQFSQGSGGDLVVNGSFETPGGVPLYPGWVTFYSGQSFPGWTVTGNNSVDIHSGEWGQPWTNIPQGTQALDLNGTDAAGVRQILQTDEGQRYRLSFYLSSNSACDPAVVSIAVKFGGQPVGTASFVTDHTLGNMRWDRHEFVVQASGTSADLEFTSLTYGTACGPAIDAVQVVQADETGNNNGQNGNNQNGDKKNGKKKN